MSQPDLKIQFDQKAEKFIIAFFRMIQIVRLYPNNNQLIKECISQFEITAEDLAETQDLTILLSQGQLYLQGELLHYRKETIQVIQDFQEFLLQRDLQGLVFNPERKNVTPDEIITLIRLLIDSVVNENPHPWLAQQLKDNGYTWVKLIETGEPSARKTKRLSKDKAIEAYYNAQGSVKEIVQKLSRGSQAGIRTAKRMVQNMVDLIHDDESLFLGLSAIQNYDDYTYTHSINVAILSMCLGSRIGLSRAALCHLGLCGLFHDLGKVEVPLEIINKPGKLTDQEWGKIREHPLLSVRQVLKLKTSHDLKSKIILAPFEHHLNYDLTGYPQIPSKKRVSLFGRILHITDFYDAISSPRVYRTQPYSQDKALNLMLERAGKEFDTALLKVFINLMGIYPPGTLLVLDSNELGLVVSYPDKGERTRPRVVLLVKNAEGGFSKVELVDLTEKDETSRRYKRNIVKSLHPETYSIQAASFIL